MTPKLASNYFKVIEKFAFESKKENKYFEQLRKISSSDPEFYTFMPGNKILLNLDVIISTYEFDFISIRKYRFLKIVVIHCFTIKSNGFAGGLNI